MKIEQILTHRVFQTTIVILGALNFWSEKPICLYFLFSLPVVRGRSWGVGCYSLADRGRKRGGIELFWGKGDSQVHPSKIWPGVVRSESSCQSVAFSMNLKFTVISFCFTALNS